MSNTKFSQFIDGGDLQSTDKVVGLRSGDNYIFSSSSIQPINITGSGNPNGNVAGIGGVNFYFDTSTTDLWRCISSGSITTAFWEKIQSTAINDFRNATYTYYEDTSGTPNLYQLGPLPPYVSIQSGSRITMKSLTTNTGTSTLNMGFNSDVIVVSNGSSIENLSGGEIQANGIYDFVFNGTSWILLNPNYVLKKVIRNSSYTYYEDSGTINSLVVNPFPEYFNLQAGTKITVKATNKNTGECTLKVNQFNNINIITAREFGYSSLSIDEIQANGIYDFVFNGTDWILLNPHKPPEYGVIYGASVWQNTPQTIPGNNNPTVIEFDVVNYDHYGLWNKTLKCFMAKSPGYYRLNANIYVENPIDNDISIVIRSNGNYISPGNRLNQMRPSNYLPPQIGGICLSGTLIQYASSYDTTFDLCMICGFNPVTIGGPDRIGFRFQFRKIY